MGDALVGTWSLVRLWLRRDRWVLSAWVVAFAAMAGFAASASAALYPDEASRVEAAKTLNATVAMVAMFGRIYDPTSLGELSMIKYTAFMAAAVAILMVVITVRHTRAEEETGRLELASGGRLGRDAPLASTLIVTFSSSIVLGLLTAAFLAQGGLPVEGSFAFGLGWAATGMAFSAVAAVAAQLTTSARSATGMGISVVAATYILRGIGDLADPGPSAFSWLSPIGWNQQIRAFAGDRWWVLAFPLALCVALVPIAFRLRAHRDLGGGMRADRPGPATGKLRGVGGLALRLHDRVWVAWAVGVAVMGFVVGTLISSVTDFLSSSNARDLIEKLGGINAETIGEIFLSAEVGLVGIMIAAYGISAANRLRSEETEGHAESILGTTSTRARWMTSHAVAALAGVGLLLALLGFSVGCGAAVDTGDAVYIWKVTLGGLAAIPAAWVMIGICLAVFGWWPRLAGWVWGLFFVYVALGEFGELWGAPQWVMDLSPFQHTPKLPVGSDSIPALAALVGVAAVLGALGYVGWRRRDTAP